MLDRFSYCKCSLATEPREVTHSRNMHRIGEGGNSWKSFIICHITLIALLIPTPAPHFKCLEIVITVITIYFTTLYKIFVFILCLFINKQSPVHSCFGKIFSKKSYIIFLFFSNVSFIKK